MPAESFVRKARRVVIACRVMEPELTSVLSEGEAGDDQPLLPRRHAHDPVGTETVAEDDP